MAVRGAVKDASLSLRHAERLELLHWEEASFLLRVLVPLRHPTVVSFVVAHAWDLTLLGLDHGPQVLFVEVEFLRRVVDDFLIAHRDGCTECGK